MTAEPAPTDGSDSPGGSAPGRVGFVGLGNMGVPMVRRLAAAGFEVRGYDVAPEARAALADIEGAEAVDDLAAVGQGAAFVVLMLPGSSVVDAVLHEGGLLDAVVGDAVVHDGGGSPGAHPLAPVAPAVLIDMSSSEPARTRELAAEAAERGVDFLDAPVSGGVRGAVAGTLTIMVGGRTEAMDRCRLLFDSLGGRVLHAGGPGAGHAVKALNNLMSASHLLASSEAMLAGIAFGLDPSVILDIVNGSSGRSGSTETKWPDYVLTGTYGSGFSLQLMVKDMGIALDLARRGGVPSRLAETAVEVWSEALVGLPAGADHTEIVRWLEKVSPPSATVPAAGALDG